MTQDYARSGKQTPPRGASPRRSERGAAAPRRGVALPYLAGLATGLLVSLLVWLTGWLPAAEDDPAAEPGGVDAVPPPGIRFEFPDVLRNAEVLVPYVEEYLQPKAAPEPDVDYMLQAGAFKSADDANRRRAAILLLDLKARTLRVTRQGESWHRVLVGPFSDRSSVREAQVRLLEEDIDSIVLKAAREPDTG